MSETKKMKSKQYNKGKTATKSEGLKKLNLQLSELIQSIKTRGDLNAKKKKYTNK